MRPSTQLTARAALCLATGVPLSLFLGNAIGAFVVAEVVRGVFRVDRDKDRLREEVAQFLDEYDGLDDEALDDLLTVFLVRTYPTQQGQDN